MRYIILAVLLLAGCTAVQQTPTAPIQFENKEKDKYIEKVEAVVADSASALTAIVAGEQEGLGKELLRNQVTRLSGIAKPSVEKVEYYTKILKDGDTKAIQKDKDEAVKVDAETDYLYGLVEQKDKELSDANARADAEFEQKILWMFSCVGIGVATIGILIASLTTAKRAGAIVFIGGCVLMSSLWVFKAVWFKWVAGTAVALGLLDGLWILLQFTIKTVKDIKRPEVAKDEPSKQGD